MRLLDRRHTVKRLSMIVVMATAIFGAIISVTQNSKKEAGAITQNGANVTVIQGQEIEYVGAGTGNWSTHRYSIQSGSSTYLGFCANPTKTPPMEPTPNHPAVLISSNARKYQKIKLAAYIYSVSNDTTNAILNRWFQPLPDTNLRYAYIHAIIGLLNDGTELALPEHWAETVSGELDEFIDGNSAVWQQASRYQLYELDLTNYPNYQNIMWIEPKPFGSIKVTKKDATTKSTNPQGNASFDGIKFTAKKGQIEKSCTLSDDSYSCTISDLEYGEYTVSESAGNNTYQVNVNKTVIVNGGTEDVEFENKVKKGSIKVRKKDSKMQDGVCKTTSGHSFNGITFGLYLDKSTKKPISYGGQTYQPNGGLIARKTIGQDGCEVTFDNLPIAKYYIKEILANNDYILSDEIEYAEITATNNSTAIEVEFSNAPTSLGTVATDKNDGDHYIEAQSDATIVDKVGYCVEPNKHYTIKGVLMDKSTGKELLIDGKKIESSADINPTTSCGSASMEFAIDARELGGKDVVVFERLYEHKEDGDYENEEPIVKHENLNDPGQTITIISLGTQAKDGVDEDKQILADKTAVIKDVISYCVRPGQKYTIRGILMNKATGEPVLVNGNKVEGEMEIEPTEACGTAEMLFHFDATGMEGKEVVVFEKLFIFNAEISDNDDPIITHEDINDEEQAVFIYLPPPDTGRFPSQNGSTSINGFIIVPAIIGVVVSGYEFRRVTAKRRFLRKK